MMDGFVYGACAGSGSRSSRTSSTSWRLRRAARRACCAGSSCGCVASGLYGHVLYTGLVGHGDRRTSSRGAATAAARQAAARSRSGCSAPAVLGHFLWNSPLLDLSRASRGRGGDWLVIPVATAVKGLPLLLFVTSPWSWRAGASAGGSRPRCAERSARRGISADELAVLRRPERRRAAAARDAARAPGAAPPAAQPAPAGAGEPRDGPLDGGDRRRPRARCGSARTAGRSATRCSRSPARRPRTPRCAATGDGSPATG